mmetsp:Transcript_81997/g.228550  ORF Transcript_81997/g.228550 Transcript_81997/m.228550 type:complete len:532 (+) Transcript_81997:193-1788(+)
MRGAQGGVATAASGADASEEAVSDIRHVVEAPALGAALDGDVAVEGNASDNGSSRGTGHVEGVPQQTDTQEPPPLADEAQLSCVAAGAVSPSSSLPTATDTSASAPRPLPTSTDAFRPESAVAPSTSLPRHVAASRLPPWSTTVFVAAWVTALFGLFWLLLRREICTLRNDLEVALALAIDARNPKTLPAGLHWIIVHTDEELQQRLLRRLASNGSADGTVKLLEDAPELGLRAGARMLRHSAESEFPVLTQLGPTSFPLALLFDIANDGRPTWPAERRLGEPSATEPRSHLSPASEARSAGQTMLDEVLDEHGIGAEGGEEAVRGLDEVHAPLLAEAEKKLTPGTISPFGDILRLFSTHEAGSEQFKAWVRAEVNQLAQHVAVLERRVQACESACHAEDLELGRATGVPAKSCEVDHPGACADVATSSAPSAPKVPEAPNASPRNGATAMAAATDSSTDFSAPKAQDVVSQHGPVPDPVGMAWSVSSSEEGTDRGSDLGAAASSRTGGSQQDSGAGHESDAGRAGGSMPR